VKCSEHHGLYRDYFSKYATRQVYLPLHVFLDPDGKEIFRKETDLGVEGFRAFLEEGFARAGKGLSPRRYRELLRDFEAAGKAVGAKEYRKAIEAYDRIAKLKVRAGIVGRARQALEGVDEIGDREVERARRLAREGNQKDALTALLEVARELAGLPCAAAAQKAWKELKAKQSPPRGS
jgi:hypothetical protein